MARRRPELSEKLKELKDTVAAAEGNAEGLKVWAMQDLGVQASSRVLSSVEPLKTLRDVCQNFPFTARTLSKLKVCLLYTSPSPRDRQKSRMPSSA